MLTGTDIEHFTEFSQTAHFTSSRHFMKSSAGGLEFRVPPRPKDATSGREVAIEMTKPYQKWTQKWSGATKEITQGAIVTWWKLVFQCFKYFFHTSWMLSHSWLFEGLERSNAKNSNMITVPVLDVGNQKSLFVLVFSVMPS